MWLNRLGMHAELYRPVHGYTRTLSSIKNLEANASFLLEGLKFRAAHQRRQQYDSESYPIGEIFR
jgi:hypothetical protein